MCEKHCPTVQKIQSNEVRYLICGHLRVISETASHFLHTDDPRATGQIPVVDVAGKMLHRRLLALIDFTFILFPGGILIIQEISSSSSPATHWFV